HQHVYFVPEKSADAPELEFLFDVYIDRRPSGKIRRHDLQEPLVARVTFHTDAQRAALAFRKLFQLLFRMDELGHQPVGDSQQVFASLRRPQAPAVALPDRHAKLIAELAYRM